MAFTETEKRIEDILKYLKEDKKQSIVLTGDHGIGKTWTARKVLERARKFQDTESFGFTLWISLNRNPDKFFLYRKISSQLFLPSNRDEDGDGYDFEREEHANDNKERMLEKLKKTLSAKLANKRYLIIMDDQQNGIDAIRKELLTVLPPLAEKNSKILITKTVSDENNIKPIEDKNEPIEDKNEPIEDKNEPIEDKNEPIEDKNEPIEDKIEPIEDKIEPIKDKIKPIKDKIEPITIEIKPLPEKESLNLLEKVIPQSGYKSQFKFIAKLCNGMPDQIIVIANLLRFILVHDPEKEVGNLEAMLVEREIENDYQKVTRFLTSYLANFQKTDMIFECSWSLRRIFKAAKCSVHYKNLITYLMLEGCLGDVDEVDKVYERGHAHLMTLVHRGLLTKHDDNFVDMNRRFLEVGNNCLFGPIGQAGIGLENVFEDQDWEGVEKICKSINKDEGVSNKKVKTLLIDWHRLCREVPESLFKSFSGLRILALFNPTFESIPSSFSSLQQQLNVLVLRGCPFLNNIDNIKELDKLRVLEVTGAISLEKLPDDLFGKMSKLCTVSFSGENIKSIPSTISKQKELRRLILRGCSALNTLPSISESIKLEIIDLSGAKSFTKFNDRSFCTLLQLQCLDVSDTKIEMLPILKKLNKLTKLLLSGSSVSRLRNLDDLTTTEIIDISNSKISKEIKEDVFTNKAALRIIKFSGTKIEKFPSTSDIQKLEIMDLSNNLELATFEDISLGHLKFLRVLDVSKTSIRKLPILSKLHNLRSLRLDDCLSLKELPDMAELTRLEDFDLSNCKEIEKIEHLKHEKLLRLFLRGCVKLQKLPSLETAKKLEVLDLSGCESLTELEDASFEHLTQLKKLKLSKTKIKTLPSLSNLTNLEELDLSGANSLGEVQGHQFLQHMPRLQVLNFSGIAQVTLTSMSNLPNLNQLILHGCSELDCVLDLEKLSELQILDLSATKISSLPPLKYLTNLQKLLLRDLYNVKELKELQFLTKLEALDLFGTGLKDFPYEISRLSCLNQLYLPKINGHQVDWGRIKWLPKEVNFEDCDIFGLTDSPIQSNNTDELSVTLTSTKLFEFFAKVPAIWETYFKKFQISIISPEYIADTDPILLNAQCDMFRDKYNAHYRKSPNCYQRCLEIRGFDTLPDSLNDVLSYAYFVSITDNKFNNSLHKLGGDNIKHFSIERCNETEFVFKLGKEDGDSRSVGGLEVLYVSNMEKMKNVICSDENLHKESFKNLKELYLDCCPELVSLFNCDKAPENLEIIHIKFCDKLEVLFGDKTHQMKKLSKLHLFQLPRLKTVGDKLQSLEKLDTLRIGFCDKLEMVSEENDFKMPTLQNLDLKNLPMLKSIGTTSLPANSIKECPLLRR